MAQDVFNRYRKKNEVFKKLVFCFFIDLKKKLVLFLKDWLHITTLLVQPQHV
jgi:hypothetical protein